MSEPTWSGAESNHSKAIAIAKHMGHSPAEIHQNTDTIDHLVGRFVGGKMRWPAEIADLAGVNSRRPAADR